MNTLDYAIKMEYDGEKYYREQGELNKEKGLYYAKKAAEADPSNQKALEIIKPHE